MTCRDVPLRVTTADMLVLIAAASKTKLPQPVAGKPFVLPTLDQLLIKLIVLYIGIVLIATALTFVFKRDPPSWVSSIAFWIITLAFAVLVFRT
jgi:hypothetical protein